MRKLNQSGSLLVPFVLVLVLLIASIGFGAWAFTNMQDYKNNSDKKSAVAAAAAADAKAKEKDAAFAEAEKSPVKNYKGPETYGGISFDYPKTWSAYVSETGKSNSPIDGYFQRNYVPDISSDIAFALRIQVVNTGYEQVLKTFDNPVKTGKAKVSAYRAPKVDSVLGSMVEGELVSGKKQGTMVILPLRDKTLKIWTEGSESLGDFNNTILASMTFAP